MTVYQTLFAFLSTVVLIFLVYRHTGFKEIKDCYSMWFTKKYWTSYNTVEFISWIAKAIIIIPGLVFKIQLWWLFFLTLLMNEHNLDYIFNNHMINYSKWINFNFNKM